MTRTPSSTITHREVLVNRFIKAAAFFVTLAFFAAGCQKESGPTTPGIETSQQTILGTTSGLLTMTNWIQVPNLPIDLLPLPASRRRIEYTSSTKIVDPNTTTVINASYTYVSVLGNTVKVNASITFPPRAVSRATEVTMEIDTVAMGVAFSPEGIHFNRDVLVDYSVTDAGPLSLGTTPLGFWYWSNEGACEYIRCDAMRINTLKGNISMTGARLSHFSQYAFGRRSAE